MRRLTKQTWWWMGLLGPSAVVDGIFMTLTWGLYSPKMHLVVAVKLARARMLLE